MAQQPGFSRQPSTESGQTSIRTDNSMAWDHNWNRVSAIGCTNSSHRLWSADSFSNVPIATGSSKGYFLQCIEHLALKDRPGWR